MGGSTLQGPSIDWVSLSPLLVLLGGAMVLLVVGALTPLWPKRLYALFTAAVATTAGVLGVVLWHQVDREGPTTLVKDALTLDKMSVWLLITVAVALVMASFITDDYLRREGLDGPEVYAMYLLAAIGGVVMGAANDLIVLFLGLEILSIALYVLAASHRKRIESQESGLKYFVLGGFSSAIFLYGVALVYGATGTTNLRKVLAAFAATTGLENSDEALVLAGVALMLVGLMFKVAAVPFHFWTPDVYQGAPTPVTGFMASAAKAAAFVAMLRVLLGALPAWSDDYRPVVWVLTVLTLVGGSVMAVVQTSVKRMLAFSSVSHAGFMLVGVEAAVQSINPSNPVTNDGSSSVLLYTLIYAVLVGGTFAVVTAVGRTGDGATDLAGFRGLGRTKPVLALAMTVLLLAQAGVPLTSGFIAKFNVIAAAVNVQSYAVAIIAMVAAVIAAFLYLRIMISMWVADAEAGDDAREPVRVPALLGVTIAISVVFTLAIGVYPSPLLDIVP
ncbi:MAG TPA: NADH-quinone oxidoreductase subunit N [Acidimicrobiaceae bacterium]|nr:NADH-quinone oxidoreductase subunit N [Acidimicrobiaceae bacterium]